MKRPAKIWIGIGVAVVALAGGVSIFFPQIKRQFFRPTESNLPQGQSVNNVPTTPVTTPRADIEVVAENLDIPWEIVWLPDGSLLITERPGQLLLIKQDRTRIPIQGVEHRGEGGLLGMTLHPKFAENQLVYLYLTTVSGEGLTNRVERYRLEGNKLSDRKVILADIPGAAVHDGGRLAFGPDGFLYITTGDAGDSANAQDKTSLAGKILRLRDDGSVPDDNPFDNEVWSYGHRNVQGITWDDQGRLWATEHGPSGSPPNSGQDELNLIEKGKNYGWPTIMGDQKRAGLEAPIIQSGANETWAPSGAVFYRSPGAGSTQSSNGGDRGSIFFAGLRGESLYEAQITGDRSVSLKAHFREEFGRLRTVTLGPDGDLYILTNNTDGRGSPKTGDDKLIRINPKIL